MKTLKASLTFEGSGIAGMRQAFEATLSVEVAGLTLPGDALPFDVAKELLVLMAIHLVDPAEIDGLARTLSEAPRKTKLQRVK